MRVTIKGQVTIPRHIREKIRITPNSEVDFHEKRGRVYLVKATKKDKGLTRKSKFRRFRGVATIRMTTDEIMALTRGAK